MVAQQHSVLAAEVLDQPGPLLQVGRDAFVLVIGDVVARDHGGLGVRQQPLAHGRHRLAMRRMQVEHGLRILPAHVDGGVDHEAGRIDDVGRLHHRLTLDVDLHQRRGGDLLEHQLVGVDQEVVLGAGHARRQMGEDQVVPPVYGDQAIGRRQVDADRPLLWRDPVADGAGRLGRRDHVAISPCRPSFNLIPLRAAGAKRGRGRGRGILLSK